MNNALAESERRVPVGEVWVRLRDGFMGALRPACEVLNREHTYFSWVHSAELSTDEGAALLG